VEKYVDESIQLYLDDLAARKPAPGGGSVGALAGTLAAGLVSMVANFSLGKEPCCDAKISEVLQESERVRKRLSELVDEDVKVYQKVSSAFKLPKNTPQEKEKRKEEVQTALKEAAKVPLEITKLALRIGELNKELFSLANPGLISDIGVSLALADSSVEIGALNVGINLSSIKDEEFCKKFKEQVDSCLNKSKSIKESIYPQVVEKI